MKDSRSSLSCRDSNSECKIQGLVCYHYTTAQNADATPTHATAKSIAIGLPMQTVGVYYISSIAPYWLDSKP